MNSILEELKAFRRDLEEYYYFRRKLIRSRKKLTPKELTKASQLHDKLAVKAGNYQNLISDVTEIKPIIRTSAGENNIWTWALSFSTNSLVVDALDQVIQAVPLAIGKIQRDISLGRREQETGELTHPSVESKFGVLKAFIAHEGETKALTKLTDFLSALKIELLIAEKIPSDSSLVETHVGSNIHRGDFVIILATKGKAINKKTKKPYMGLNVADELGRAREANKKVILLLENGVDPHTNISGIIWENFTPQSMDKAFIKIVRELTNWGFITAGTIK